MMPNQEPTSGQVEFQRLLSHLDWLVKDTFTAVGAGGQLHRVEARLDEIGDLLADCRGLLNTAKAANTQSVEQAVTGYQQPSWSADIEEKPSLPELPEVPQPTEPLAKPKKGGKG